MKAVTAAVSEGVAMSSQGAPPGWHPDPAAPDRSVRWWDGGQWTDHTQPVAPTAPAPVLPGPGVAPAHLPPVPPTAPGIPAVPAFRRAPVQRSVVQANSVSLTALALVAAYLVLALLTHFVLIGILPVVLAARAYRNRERLAPLAIAGAAVTVVVAVIVLAHH